MKKANISRLEESNSSDNIVGGKKKEDPHMLNKHVRTADVYHTSETHLRDDRSELTAGSRDTVSGGAVTSGEHLSRNNESGRVRTEVLEEVGETI